VRLGLFDIDSVKEPGIGVRLIYATVVPCDEQDFSGNTLKALNIVVQCLIEV